MTPNDLAKHVDDIIRKPSAKKKLKNGREAYWDEKSGTVVIVNPNDPDGGTVFKPDIGKQYFDHDLK